MRKWRLLDAWLAGLSLAFAAPSLTYPLSRDQGIFYYVGREWLLRGAMPYRDAIDNKTPFIYGVNALCIAAFGETMWGIRFAEIVAVALLGVLVARLAKDPGRESAGGTTGASMLVASVFYYGYLPFQDSANCEIWCALFVVAAAVAARDARSEPMAGLLAGSLMGLAVLAKPPSLVFAPLIVHALLGRRRAWAATGIAVAALTVVLGSVVLYFAARDAAGDLVDLTVRANAAFAVEGRKVRTVVDWPRRLYAAIDWYEPWSYVFPAACAVALVRARPRPFSWGDPRLARRYLQPLAWAACSYAAVALQLKFFVYHHALFVVPCALLGAALWSGLSTNPRLTGHPGRIGAAAFIFAAGVVLSCVANTPSDVWLLRARNALRWASGRLSGHDLVGTFDDPHWIDLTSAQRVGEFVRGQSGPDDLLLVRAYEPEVYFFAQRHYAGRFFWSTMLESPVLDYRRAEWLAQDRADIVRLRPAWVVTWAEPPSGAECERPAWFESMGWTRRAAVGPYVVLSLDR